MLLELSCTTGLSVYNVQSIVEALSVSDDEQRPRRRASERAVDPVSRTLLATAEGHQDYVDEMELFVDPFWRDWLANWILGSLSLVAAGLALVFYWVQLFPLALLLGLGLLVIGTVALAYPWMYRERSPRPSESGEG